MHSKTTRRSLAVLCALAALIIAVGVSLQAQSAKPILSLRGTSANVSGAGETVRIDLLRWSTDAERDQMLVAWNPPAAPPEGARGGGAAAGGGARGGAAGAGAGGGGGAADAGAAAGGGARGGAAGGGAGARGGGAPAAPRPPEAALLAALQAVPTVGYLWTSESIGYSVKYAYRIPSADGGERIILALDRRLGASNPLWRPAGSATPTNYEFTLIELRLNSRGEGEGKASLVTRVTIDNEAKTMALDGYASAPVILQVKS